MAADQGVTHIALPVSNLDASLDFYARFADMHVVHRREDSDGSPVAWISDHLGFSDPRAFRRAFARWTGMSPDRYRRMRWVREVA